MIQLSEVFKDGIDATMIDLWQQCRRKFYNRIIRGLEMGEVSTSLDFGQKIHQVLEEYFKGLLTETQAIQRWKGLYVDRGLDERRTSERGEALLKEYFRVFPREHEPFEILEVETPFKTDIGAKVPFAGRRDLVVQDKYDKTIWVMDHKTTSGFGDTYHEGFEIHTALDGYMLDAMNRFGACEGVILNVLVTSKTKPHCERVRVMRTREQLEFWKEGTRRVVDEIVEYVIDHYPHKTEDGIKEAYPLSRGRCRDYNAKCLYFDLCKFCDNQAIIQGDFKVKRWTPFPSEEGK